MDNAIDTINIAIFSIVIFLIAFFVFRRINLWYWKIDEFKKAQDEQIRLLKKIAGEEADKNERSENFDKIFSLITLMCCFSITGYAQTIDGGSQHSIMICTDSTIWAVGYNGIGLLGDSTTINSLTIVPTLGLTSVVSVSSGYIHNLALEDNGIVWAWGANSFGQLGNGQTSLSIIPIQTGINNIIAISAGSEHSLALKNNGTVWAWGKNSNGQLGDGTGILPFSSNPIQVVGLAGLGFLSGIVDIDNGNKHSLALKNDSTIWAWGANGTGQLGDNTTASKNTPIKVKGIGNIGYLNDIIKISGGVGHSLALKSDSTVLAWGLNTWGQLGNGGTNTEETPILIAGLANIINIDAGENYSLALRSDGTVWAWGNNGIGQLGNGTTVTSKTPIQVLGLTNIIEIGTGYDFNLALKDDNTIWVWGKNDDGQLGDGTTINRLIPVQMASASAFMVSATNICLGESIVFTNTTIGATSFNWQIDGITFSMGIDTLKTFNVAGTYTVSLIAYSEDCVGNNISDTSNIIITVDSLVITNLDDNTVCNGDSILIFGVYQQTPGIYYDSLSTQQGCDSIIQITLTVNLLPIVNFTGLDSVYCNGDILDTLTGLPSGGIFSGITGNTFDPSTTGTFTISYSYTDINGCSDTESQDAIVTTCTGIEGLRFNDFKVYPNPSTGIVNIQTDKQVEIINTLGQIISTEHSIDLSEYGSGIYFVKSGTTVKKLIITK